jgi:hypothetical protein
MDVSERLAQKGIYVPPSARIHDKPPKYRCNFCGQTFTEDQGRKRDIHMARHAKKDADDIRAIAARRREGPGQDLRRGRPREVGVLEDAATQQLRGQGREPAGPKALLMSTPGHDENPHGERGPAISAVKMSRPMS